MLSVGSRTAPAVDVRAPRAGAYGVLGVGAGWLGGPQARCPAGFMDKPLGARKVSREDLGQLLRPAGWLL